MTHGRFDNFHLMADKIQVSSTDKRFVVQSDDEAMKRCFMVYVKLWSPIKAWQLFTQVFFFESKGFHIRSVVADDFIRVNGYRNISVTACGAWPDTKLFEDNHQAVTLTGHNDIVLSFIFWHKEISLGAPLNIPSQNSALEFLAFCI